MNTEQYFTVQEVAERLGMSPETIRRYIREGRLVAERKQRGSGYLGYLIPEEEMRSIERSIEPTGRRPEAPRSKAGPTMARLDFLNLAATFVVTTAGGLFSGAFVLARERALNKRDRELLKSAMRDRRKEEARSLFEELFGAPAKRRTDYEGTHPDNLAAGRNLRPVLGLYDSPPITPPRGSQLKTLPEGDVVLIGGPNSTPLTMIAWEFHGSNMRELDRDPDPIIPLRFYGISNEQDPSLPEYRVSWNLEGVGTVPAVPWPLMDTKTGEPHFPERGAEVGENMYEIASNYLLVTKLPNFLDPNRQGHPNSWPQMLVFEANNGIGTRAAELLLQPAGLEALEHVKNKLRGATAFQALFRVYDLDPKERRFNRFRKIEPLDWAIEPLRIDKPTYQRAYEKLAPRMSEWGLR